MDNRCSRLFYSYLIFLENLGMNSFLNVMVSFAKYQASENMSYDNEGSRHLNFFLKKIEINE